MAKTIEEIKEAQAVNHGWHSYEKICESFRTGTISNNSFNDFLDDVIKDYANQKLEEAAETVNIQRDYTYADGKVQKEYYKKCVIGAYMYTIDKQSILNLREEV